MLLELVCRDGAELGSPPAINSSSEQSSSGCLVGICNSVGDLQWSMGRSMMLQWNFWKPGDHQHSFLLHSSKSRRCPDRKCQLFLSLILRRCSFGWTVLNLLSSETKPQLQQHVLQKPAPGLSRPTATFYHSVLFEHLLL